MQQQSITYRPAQSWIEKHFLYSLSEKHSIYLFHLQHATRKGENKRKESEVHWWEMAAFAPKIITS